MNQIVRRERIIRRRDRRKVTERQLLKDSHGKSKDLLPVFRHEGQIRFEMRLDRTNDRRIFAEFLHEGFQIIVVRPIGEQNTDEEIEEKITVDLQTEIGGDRMFLLTGAEKNSRRMEVMFKALEEIVNLLEIIDSRTSGSLGSKWAHQWLERFVPWTYRRAETVATSRKSKMVSNMFTLVDVSKR